MMNVATRPPMLMAPTTPAPQFGAPAEVRRPHHLGLRLGGEVYAATGCLCALNVPSSRTVAPWHGRRSAHEERRGREWQKRLSSVHPYSYQSSYILTPLNHAASPSRAALPGDRKAAVVVLMPSVAPGACANSPPSAPSQMHARRWVWRPRLDWRCSNAFA